MLKFYKFIFIFSILVSLTIRSNGQYTPGCGTEPMDSVNVVNQPYFGNNQFLLDLVDSVENSSYSNCRTVTGG